MPPHRPQEANDLQQEYRTTTKNERKRNTECTHKEYIKKEVILTHIKAHLWMVCVVFVCICAEADITIIVTFFLCFFFFYLSILFVDLNDWIFYESRYAFTLHASTAAFFPFETLSDGQFIWDALDGDTDRYTWPARPAIRYYSSGHRHLISVQCTVQCITFFIVSLSGMI